MLSFPLNFPCSFSCVTIFLSGVSHFLTYIHTIIEGFTSGEYCDAERAKAFHPETLFAPHSSRVPRVETPLDLTNQYLPH